MQPTNASDRGFTLVEVIIAISILGILATSAVIFAVQAMNTSAAQQQRQVAVAIAMESMEGINARVAATDPVTGASYLVRGRHGTAVSAAWAAYGAVPGIADSYPYADPSATASSTPDLPITSTVNRNGAVYTVTLLIGQCCQPLAGGTCAKAPGYASTPPSTTPAGSAEPMMRVVTVVEWTAGDACSTVSPCQYWTVSLVDGTPDQEWRN